jgi:NAD(P)-dependent dehydrogenase (short-subunit alcohol dehydrogenase family)
MNDMIGKVALVTGGGSGIGRETSLLFARRGASVVVADIDLDNAQTVAAAIEAAGGKALALRVDVTDESSVQAMVARSVERFGAIDCAANNAGITGPISEIVDMPLSDARMIVEVDLISVFLCMKEELKVMLPRGKGAIVNTCSIWGLVAGANYAMYSAAKHGVAGLTKAGALEVATRGVRVNAICPGFTVTPMLTDQGLKLKPGTEAYAAADNAHPIGRMGRPGEIAEGIVWLASDAASFVTGTCLSADGGFTAR